MKEDIQREISVPEGVNVELAVDGTLSVKGSQGEIKRGFHYPKIKLSVENNIIVLDVKSGSKREKRIVSTYAAHIKNMLKGVQEKFEYKLKICSGHFPMNVSVSGNKFIVKNFLGEKHPREIVFPAEVDVKVNGQEVEVKGCSKELVGQVSAKIEQMCRITNRDIRIFQDGIYITNKAK